MKYFYSESSNSFYPEDIKDIYEFNGSWPPNAIEIEYSQFQEFSLNPVPVGKVRGFTKELGLYWANIPQLSLEELCTVERDWRDQELVRADQELNKVQDLDPKAKGTVGEWRDYRRKLRNYPETEDFPNKENRPLAPY